MGIELSCHPVMARTVPLEIPQSEVQPLVELLQRFHEEVHAMREDAIDLDREIADLKRESAALGADIRRLAERSRIDQQEIIAAAKEMFPSFLSVSSPSR